VERLQEPNGSVTRIEIDLLRLHVHLEPPSAAAS
jgi:hypothetical protein